MFVGKKGYYFLKVILFLAFSKKESFLIKELSKRLEISEKVLEQVLLSLKNKGILSSKRGPQGGYWLSRDVSEMTVMEIIEMTGKNFDILPIEKRRRTNVMDEILSVISDKIEDELIAKLKEVKIRQLVGYMRKKVTEKGLSYMI